MTGMLQFVLDLFGGGAPSRPAPRPRPNPKKDKKKSPLAQSQADFLAINSVATDADAATPAGARNIRQHPRANRRVRLGNGEVAYEFQRARRRTIGFSVGLEGLSVRAPRAALLSDVESALQEKAVWIERKLDEMQRRQHALDSARIVWRDGVALDYLGQPLVVRLAGPSTVAGATQRQARVACTWRAATGAQPAALEMALPADAPPERIRDAAQAWLMQQARALFVERLDAFAPRLAVQWRTLALSNAATRWGSASASGAIRLNWRLIHFDAAVIDYVVVHELSHLRFMDHSPRFWATVGSVLPDYAQPCRLLRRTTIPRWE